MPVSLGYVRSQRYAIQKELREIDELMPAEAGGETDSLTISDTERTALIRFFREVVRGGMDEQLWRAKNPKEHALLIRTCGSVQKPEPLRASGV